MLEAQTGSHFLISTFVLSLECSSWRYAQGRFGFTSSLVACSLRAVFPLTFLLPQASQQPLSHDLRQSPHLEVLVHHACVCGALGLPCTALVHGGIPARNSVWHHKGGCVNGECMGSGRPRVSLLASWFLGACFFLYGREGGGHTINKCYVAELVLTA